MGRLELPDGAEDGLRRRHVFVREVLGERVPIEVAGNVGVDEQRLQLGSEEKRPRELRVVERLLPETIAGEQETATPSVPEREGEHAFQTFEGCGSVVLVGVEDDLGV